MFMSVGETADLPVQTGCFDPLPVILNTILCNSFFFYFKTKLYFFIFFIEKFLIISIKFLAFFCRCHFYGVPGLEPSGSPPLMFII